MMPRALLLFAHPCEESFVSALHATTRDTLAAAGWEVDDCDLYAEGFDPVLSPQERRDYLTVGVNTAPVQHHVDRLRAADALVLVFPVWNFGYPAILKGYFDRVFLPGVSFELTEKGVQPCLTNIRKLAAITTYGATPMRAFLAGDPPRKMVKRVLWGTFRPDKLRYLALHDMNRVTPDQRAAHLARVKTEMERF